MNVPINYNMFSVRGSLDTKGDGLFGTPTIL
jgi:hypothetical protein